MSGKAVVLVKDSVRNDPPTAYLTDLEDAERFELAVEDDRPDLDVTILYNVHEGLPELDPVPIA